jgi:hypothetical protein
MNEVLHVTLLSIVCVWWVRIRGPYSHLDHVYCFSPCRKRHLGLLLGARRLLGLLADCRLPICTCSDQKILILSGLTTCHMAINVMRCLHLPTGHFLSPDITVVLRRTSGRDCGRRGSNGPRSRDPSPGRRFSHYNSIAILCAGFPRDM